MMQNNSKNKGANQILVQEMWCSRGWIIGSMLYLKAEDMMPL